MRLLISPAPESRNPTLLNLLHTFTKLTKLNDNLINLILNTPRMQIALFELIAIELDLVQERADQKLKLIFFHDHELVAEFFHFFFHLSDAL